MTIALIAHASGQGESGISNQASMNTTGADFLIAVLACFDAGATPISDSKGNTWTAVAAGVGSDPTVTVYYSIPTSVGSSHTFSSTGSFASMSIAAFSGVAQSSPVDKTSSATFATQPGSLTPSNDNSLWITGYGYNFLSAAPTANSPFTTESVKDHVSGSTYASGIAWDIQTTATARNPTWSDTGHLYGVVFKPAAGGSTSDTVGTASGTSTASGVGASTAATTGSAAGFSTASGVGASSAATAGSASGAATVAGVGAATPETTGTASGEAGVSGVGGSIAATEGTASGTSTVSGVGSSVSQGATVGTASGTSTVSGVGASVAETVGTASGSATVIGFSSGGAVIAQPKPSGAPGHRVKFRGQFYDSVRDRHRLARDVNEFLSEKQEEQKPAQKQKRKAVKVSGVKIETPPVVLDTREIDELSDVLAQLKARDAQFTAYIAQLRAINEALMRDEEEFLAMVA